MRALSQRSASPAVPAAHGRCTQRPGSHIQHETCRPASSLPRRRRRTSLICKASDTTSDFVVLGAGIIGLACARELLQREESASVTVLEQGQAICSGATGAGQGCADAAALRAPTLGSAVRRCRTRTHRLWNAFAMSPRTTPADAALPVLPLCTDASARRFGYQFLGVWQAAALHRISPHGGKLRLAGCRTLACCTSKRLVVHLC